MRKATNYLIALLSLIAVTLISSCSSDDDNNPETGPLLIWKKSTLADRFANLYVIFI